MYKNIVLLGFRGTGKSTLSKILAQKLDWQTLEMDQLLESKAGKSISEITLSGTHWGDFREQEFALLKELLTKQKVVISGGGGLGVNDLNGQIQADFLSSCADTLKIVLVANESVIRSRLTKDFLNKQSQHRPSLTGQKEDLDDFLENNFQAYKARKPLYESLSKIQIDTSEFSSENLANTIYKQFKDDLYT